MRRNHLCQGWFARSFVTQEEEQHPAMKAIARQQRAPGLVPGLPKCLGRWNESPLACQKGKVAFVGQKSISMSHKESIQSSIASSCERIKFKEHFLKGFGGSPRDLELVIPEVSKLLRPWVGCRGWDLQTWGFSTLNQETSGNLSLHFSFFPRFWNVVLPHFKVISPPPPPLCQVDLWCSSDFKKVFQIPRGKQ